MVITTATPSTIRAALEAGDAQTFTTTKKSATDYLAGLVRAGLWPTPLRSMEKRPILAGWPAFPQPTAADTRRWIDDAHPGTRGAQSTPFMGVGLRTGHGLIAADPDDPDQRAAWRAFCPRVGLDPDQPPTVTTPGAVDADGAQKHWDGGHWYILTPPDWTPPLGAVGTLKINAEGVVDGPGAKFALMVTGCQIVAPPTVRAEGAYEVTGEPQMMTPELRQWFTTTAEAARAAEVTRAAERVDRDVDPEKIAWEDAADWGDVLAPAGWWVTGSESGCGCEVWHHPDAASAKSATTHQCHRGTYLRVWSESCDALPQGTYSMLKVSAALHYDGDYSAACTAAGFPPEAPADRARSLSLRDRVADIVADFATMSDVVQPVAAPPAPAPVLTEEEQAALMPPWDAAEYPAGHPNDPELLARIFNFSPATRALYYRARNAEIYVAPVGLLLGELIRAGEVAGAEAGYETCGADGLMHRDPLSMFVTITGRSGGGKSSVLGARAGFTRPSTFQNNLTADDVERGGVASAQALVDALMKQEVDPEADEGDKTPRKVWTMKTPAVATVTVGELASLLASPSTGPQLGDALLSAWAGEPFGERSRTHGLRRVTGAYQVNMVGSIQQERADVLVGRAAKNAGLLQRLFLLDVFDPWFGPIVMGALDCGIEFSDTSQLPAVPVGQAVTLPESARRALRFEQIKIASRQRAPEDMHALHIRLRLAALMALWSGVTEVTDAMWQWSDLLMEHHRRARAATVVAAEQAARDAATEEAATRAVGASGAAELVGDMVAATGTAILSKIPPQGCSRRELRDRLTKAERTHLTAALDILVNAGQVVREVGDRGAITLKLG